MFVLSWPVVAQDVSVVQGFVDGLLGARTQDVFPFAVLPARAGVFFAISSALTSKT